MEIIRVEAAERAREAAMLAGDTAAMTRLFDAGLCWVHASGSTDSKASMIAKFASGALRTHAWDTLDATILDLGDAALVTGTLAMDVTVDGTRARRRNRFAALWRGAGDALRLAYWQSTRLPD